MIKERICFDVVTRAEHDLQFEPWIIDNDMDFAAFEDWFIKAVKGNLKFAIDPFVIDDKGEESVD